MLTNNSIFTPARPRGPARAHPGSTCPRTSIWTSALATADFLSDQMPGGSAYVIGEAGLTTALHEAGYTLTDTDPDFVVLGETRDVLVRGDHQGDPADRGGARFIATNPDATGPSAEGPLPATGAVAALITKATGKEPYFVGKPNPMMFRCAMNRIDAHSENTAMIGDRMDTDIVAGIEAGLDTSWCSPARPTGRHRAVPVPAQPDAELDRRRDRTHLIDVEIAPEVHATLRTMADRGTPPEALSRRRRSAAPSRKRPDA